MEDARDPYAHLTAETIKWHLQLSAFAVFLLFIVDRLLITPVVVRRLVKHRDVDGTRWCAQGRARTQRPPSFEQPREHRRDCCASLRFLIHAFANFVTTLTGLPAAYRVFSDPHNAADSQVYDDISMFGSASIWPLTFLNAVHIYHMVASARPPQTAASS